MKSISIPYLPEMEKLPLDQAASFAEENGAGLSVETLNWPHLFNYRPITSVFAGRTKTHLILLYRVHGNCLRAATTHDNGNVHEDSCVEFFVNPAGDDIYYNFEFNCAGVCKAARHLATRDNFEYLTPDEMQSIERWSSLGNRAFNELNGLFSWDLAVKIPFSVMGLNPENLPEKITGNFYKCADATCQPHYVTWNPVKTERPDFHRPEFFGEIRLA